MLSYAILSLFMSLNGAAAVENITPAKAAEMAKNHKAVIIDVREKDEITSGVAEPALHYPHSQIKADPKRWQEFVKAKAPGKAVVLYCAAGGRAGKAAGMLEEKGVQAFNMGGYSDWKDAGLPVRKPNP